jgi:tetratricopeptide (TPR) repeat protein
MAVSPAESNLLFGLLALQNGLINQGQLVVAFQAWSLDKARPLADHLVVRGDLDSAGRGAIEALAVLHIAKHGGDAGKSLVSIPAGPSVRDRLAALHEPELEYTLGQLRGVSHRTEEAECGDLTETHDARIAFADGSRFVMLRHHAKVAEDVEHWLADEPVRVYRDPTSTRLFRWARRHRVVVAIGAGLLQTAVVVLAVSTLLLTQSRSQIDEQRRIAVAAQQAAEQQRISAISARDRAEAVNTFLVRDFLEQANPELSEGGEKLTIRELFARSVASLDAHSTLARQRDVEAAIRSSVGDAYTVIGDPKQAVEQLEKARELLKQAHKADPSQLLRTENRLANALLFADRHEESLSLFRDVAQRARTVFGPENPETAYALGGIGNTLLALGRLDESIGYLRQASSVLDRTLGAEDRRTQSELNNLMLALADHDQLPEAEELGRRLLVLREKTHGPEHIETIYARHNLARVLLQRGKFSEALPVQTRAVEEITKLLGPENFRTLFMTNNLGMALEGNGRLDDAEATYRKTLELRRKPHGNLNSNTQRTMAFLARLLLARKKDAEFIDLVRELVRLKRGRTVPDPARDGDLDCLRDVLSETADPSTGEPLLRELLAALERTLWRGDWLTAHIRSLLGGCLLRQGRTNEAIPLLSDSLRAMEAAPTTPAAIMQHARDRLDRSHAASMPSK